LWVKRGEERDIVIVLACTRNSSVHEEIEKDYETLLHVDSSLLKRLGRREHEFENMIFQVFLLFQQIHYWFWIVMRPWRPSAAGLCSAR